MEARRPGTIATVAALAAGTVWLMSNRMKLRMNADGDLSLRKTTEVANLSMGKTLTGVAVLGLGAMLLSAIRQTDGAGSSSSSVKQTIEVNVPLSTAYNQWTQFEEFPRFMETVEEVKQIDDQHLHWRAVVAGKLKEWDARITEQIPDQRIAWTSTSGPRNAGVVTFHRIGDNKTRIMLQMDYEPETTGEKIGDALGGVKLTAKSNLKKFKELVEGRGTETGAWRGTVTQH